MDRTDYVKLVKATIDEKADLVNLLRDVDLPADVKSAEADFDAWAGKITDESGDVAPAADAAAHMARAFESIKDQVDEEVRHRMDIFGSHAGELEKLAGSTLA